MLQNFDWLNYAYSIFAILGWVAGNVETKTRSRDALQGKLDLRQILGIQVHNGDRITRRDTDNVATLNFGGLTRFALLLSHLREKSRGSALFRGAKNCRSAQKAQISWKVK